ncbi:unnamed protein product [Strongylus vulgaris]|uniref:Uncharacterized protein n=1 Tax=Strongylus vulgaris TaxID=40348 RepID=A0A3P7KD60_STRVU|nr:unnamed protein product [Strongylus vulgaris]
MPRTRNLERISKATKGMLERRRALRLDPTNTSRAIGRKYQLQNSFARRSSKVQAFETFKDSTKKEKSKEVPQEPSLLSCSADNITKRRWDSYVFPTKDLNDHEKILHQPLPLINTRVKPRYSHLRSITTILPAEVRAVIQTMRQPWLRDWTMFLSTSYKLEDIAYTRYLRNI